MIEDSLQQELREKYNPEGSMLRKIQLEMLDILLEFNRICCANDIPYWIDSGTLIGAVRHGGFIPWDDDLDVCILKKDWKRLRRALLNDLHYPYSLHDVDTALNYTHRWPRIVNEKINIRRRLSVGKDEGFEEKTEKLWLDVFLQINGTAHIARVVDSFYGRCFRRKYHAIDDGRLNHFLGVLLFPLASAVVRLIQVLGKVVYNKSLIHDFGTGFYSIRKKTDIFPLSTIEFEGHLFPAPKHYDSYLRHIYNDYTLLPPEENRETHNIISVDYENKR